MALFFHDVFQDMANLRQLMLYAAVVLLANVIQGLVVLPIFLKMKGIDPVKTFQGMAPALAMAFFAKSSNTDCR